MFVWLLWIAVTSVVLFVAARREPRDTPMGSTVASPV
jgi:hypothetical protein